MSKDNKKGNNNRNKNNNNNNINIQYVTLPYDFIEFPEKWISYNVDAESDSLPRHDQVKQLNGYIKYKLTPQSDLALEIKKGESNRLFISGSQVRGMVRKNAEILSQNYPHFINGNPMFYRDITNNSGLGKEYRDKLEISKGIDKSIEVGFLKKEGVNFYIVPAEKWPSGRNFVSIKEHRIRNMGLTINNGYSMLYKNKDECFKKINGIQKRIDELTAEIYKLRKELKKELSSIQKQANYIFTNSYNFITNKEIRDMFNATNFEVQLKNKSKELLKELNNLSEQPNKKTEGFFSKMVERWKLKAEIHSIYSKIKPNKEELEKFVPYQKEVYYNENANGGVEKISFDNNNGEFVLKGYLFNSTNASSKRSHYFIKKSSENNIHIAIPEEIIEGYRQNFKKFRDNNKGNNTKRFYDIFDDKNYLALLNKNFEGPIVFFKRDKEGKCVEMIGRTPYFKIPYNHTIKEIIDRKGYSTIGYADALFGFASNTIISPQDGKEVIDSYKSRVRFTPIDIKDKFQESDYIYKDFLLPSPFASSNAMYLKQHKGKKLSTYNDDAELNGYKYYHILDKVYESKTEPKGMISTKGVIKNNNNYYLEGKVYFKNLAPEELGLLLLSLDIKEIMKSKQYTKFAGIEKSFEQIGGAKPYGYGKVQVDITEPLLEKNDNSFKSLITDSTKIEKEEYKYIDAYINMMEKEYDCKYVGYLSKYIESKHEKNREESLNNNPMMINWYNVQEKIQKDSKNKGGGYPKSWRIRK